MNRDQLNQQLFESMTRVFKGIGSNMHRSREMGSLTRPQMGVLFSVYKNRDKQGFKVKDIADQLGVTSAAVTQFTEDLVKRDLLARNIDQEDRRGIILTLTDKAQGLFKRLKQIHFDHLRPFFDDFTDEELEQFVHLLGKIKIDRK